MLRQTPWSDFKTAYLLHDALCKRQPPISVKVGAVKTWIENYRIAADGYSLTTAKELQEQCGSSMFNLAKEYHSAFLLTKELRKRDPPRVSD